MELIGKVCLITGGTSGIGAATAVSLAHRGAHIAIASRNIPSEIPDSLSSAIRRHGTEVQYIEFDAKSAAACRDCVGRVEEHFGHIDVLIHSAGGPVPGDLFTVTDESWMDAFAVHVHAVLHLVKAAAPHMARRGEGAIMLISSAAGLRGCLGALAYGVVKGALPQFARNLARELAEHHIRVNCVSPGVIRTPFQDFLTPDQALKNIENRIPLHREGTPEDVAAIITALIENDFVTGENLVIDGGMTMRIV
ncbi:MAG TPA: SDR family oxidoreductase [Terracidiphilus sp.]|nr:SDR family oxidoreductase [Terracidiphilus sp.]